MGIDLGLKTFAAFSEAIHAKIANRRPKGRKDLGIGGWQCTVCEAVHDRNVNAAHIILAAGHRRLAEGISVLLGGEDVKA